jgi:hypothetical protein
MKARPHLCRNQNENNKDLSSTDAGLTGRSSDRIETPSDHTSSAFGSASLSVVPSGRLVKANDGFSSAQQGELACRDNEGIAEIAALLPPIVDPRL